MYYNIIHIYIYITFYTYFYLSFLLEFFLVLVSVALQQQKICQTMILC